MKRLPRFIPQTKEGIDALAKAKELKKAAQ
jgi:hypothetical protein